MKLFCLMNIWWVIYIYRILKANIYHVFKPEGPPIYDLEKKQHPQTSKVLQHFLLHILNKNITVFLIKFLLLRWNNLFFVKHSCHTSLVLEKHLGHVTTDTLKSQNLVFSLTFSAEPHIHHWQVFAFSAVPVEGAWAWPQLSTETQLILKFLVVCLVTRLFG